MIWKLTNIRLSEFYNIKSKADVKTETKYIRIIVSTGGQIDLFQGDTYFSMGLYRPVSSNMSGHPLIILEGGGIGNVSDGRRDPLVYI